MKLYLAGPMRGYHEYNFPAFAKWAAELRDKGFEVVSPAELDLDSGLDPNIAIEDLPPFKTFMKRDLPMLLECDGIALMPGWEDSRGATLEKHVAHECGLIVFELGEGANGFDYRMAHAGTRD